MVSYCFRTKWKRQTAVGLELLAEAGNYAAFQRLYGGAPYGCWPYPGAGTAGPSAADIYYRQAAAAAVSTLQKPLPYRLYPAGLGLLPGPSTAHAPHLQVRSIPLSYKTIKVTKIVQISFKEKMSSFSHLLTGFHLQPTSEL